MSALQVPTMGRVGVDLYPQQVGAGLDRVETFGKWVGGSATNVAVAAARSQRRAAVIARTGDDPFGAFVHAAPRGYGVDAADAIVTSRLACSDAMPTALEVAELLGDGLWEAASA